jgi:hypothetical protein
MGAFLLRQQGVVSTWRLVHPLSPADHTPNAGFCPLRAMPSSAAHGFRKLVDVAQRALGARPPVNIAH